MRLSGCGTSCDCKADAVESNVSRRQPTAMSGVSLLLADTAVLASAHPDQEPEGGR